MGDICTDNRFELIEKYKKELIESTNIESSQDEMAVLDDLLFRFWQIGWHDRLEQPEVDCQKCVFCGFTGFKQFQAEQSESKTGKWLWLDGVRCSNCNHKLQTTSLPSYCPNCGAWMER